MHMVRRGGSAMGSVVEADRPGIGGHKGKSILEAVPDGLRSVGHRGNDQMGRKRRLLQPESTVPDKTVTAAKKNK